MTARRRPANLPTNLLACGLALLLCLTSGHALCATHVVTQNGDAGVGSLRWAVDQANAGAAAEPQQIRFELPPAFRQIVLSGPALLVSHPDVSIEGLATGHLSDPSRISIRSTRANTDGGVLVTAPGALQLRIAHLNLGPSHRQSRQGGCVDASSLSGISAQLEIEYVYFEGCLVSTTGRTAGGAVFANGNLSLRRSGFHENRVESMGGDPTVGFGAFGGAVAMESGVLVVVEGVFTGNAAVARASSASAQSRGHGGAVAYLGANNGGVLVDDGTFIDNLAGRSQCDGSLQRPVCRLQGWGGALYTRAASTELRTSVFSRNRAMLGGAAMLEGSGGNIVRRLSLENSALYASFSFQGAFALSGSDARLRQRNSTLHNVEVGDAFGTAFLYLSQGAQVEASHSMLFGSVHVQSPGAGVQRHCWRNSEGWTVPIQGSSLIVESALSGSAHSCSFLGTTPIASAHLAGLEESGSAAIGPGLAVDNGAPGTPSALDWSRCAPRDYYNLVRPQDGDGDGDARCDIGAVELDTYTPHLFGNGFE